MLSAVDHTDFMCRTSDRVTWISYNPHGVHNPSHVLCYTPSVIVIGQHLLTSRMFSYICDRLTAGINILLYYKTSNSWMENRRTPSPSKGLIMRLQLFSNERGSLSRCSGNCQRFSLSSRHVQFSEISLFTNVWLIICFVAWHLLQQKQVEVVPQSCALDWEGWNVGFTPFHR